MTGRSPVELETATPPAAPIPLQEPGSAAYERAPRAAAGLGGLLRPLDRLFDRLYGSDWNPLYHSGSLALALMLIVSLTGVYLLLFYRIGAPYDSVVVLQEQAFAGRWMRAFHRYASDLAIVLIFFHALRMMVEGRTWGPRVLAWVSGLILVGAVWICGWTGYVLVWDQHGLRLGAAGAQVFDALPFFTTPIGRSFSGSADVGSSFFFFNLFVHMCVPLAMALLLWVHTSRLARSRWLPGRRILWTAVGATLVLSIVAPAPLDPPADPQQLSGGTTLDLFYSGWMPLVEILTPAGSLAAVLIVSIGLLVLPVWWRPRRASKPGVSRHNPSACSGCTQCTLDCPFEAVSMVPRTEGKGSAEIAAVDSSRCVSCGICAGSCEQLAIGPQVRSGHAQIRLVKSIETEEVPKATALVVCRQGDFSGSALPKLTGKLPVVPVVVDCVGSLHPLTVARLAERHRGVFIASCPVRRCSARDGVQIAAERIFEGRDPAPEDGLDATRVRLIAGSRAEAGELRKELEGFLENVGKEARPGLYVAGRRRTRRQAVWAAAVTAVLLAGVAAASAVPWGTGSEHSALRLAWRLPGQSYEDCRPLTEKEIAALPQHMRRTEDCTRIYLVYRLVVWVDGRRVLEEVVHPLGARGDRPLYVERDLPLEAGEYDLRLLFEPVQDPSGEGIRLFSEGRVRMRQNRATLVTVAGEPAEFQIRP